MTAISYRVAGFLPPLLSAPFAFLALSADAANLDKCVASIKAEARKAGIKPDIVDAAFRGITYDEKAVRFSRTQPEYRLAIWDYMAFLVDEARIADGEKMMAKHQQDAARVEKAYGVDRYILAALWGVESDYGQEKGDFFLPHGLANVACAGTQADGLQGRTDPGVADRAGGRRQACRSAQAPGPGAFGQTQFIPSTYRRLAVDFDGDGHRDTIRSVPDALGVLRQFSREGGLAVGPSLGLRSESASGL